MHYTPTENLIAQLLLPVKLLSTADAVRIFLLAKHVESLIILILLTFLSAPYIIQILLFH